MFSAVVLVSETSRGKYVNLVNIRYALGIILICVILANAGQKLEDDVSTTNVVLGKQVSMEFYYSQLHIVHN